MVYRFCKVRSAVTAIESKKAIDWSLKAAEQNDPTAQYNLAVIYAQGELTPKDYTKALFWGTKAKNNGNVDAYRLIKLVKKAKKREDKKKKER